MIGNWSYVTVPKVMSKVGIIMVLVLAATTVIVVAALTRIEGLFLI
jgi:hypothetical protein